MNQERAMEKAEEYLKDRGKLNRVIAGTNRPKKSPQARNLAANKPPNPEYVKSRFFGRLGKRSIDFKDLLCNKLNYCGENFQLARDSLKALIDFLLSLAHPVFVLLAELIFLLQHKKFRSYCEC